MDYLPELQRAIKHLHGCESRHVATTAVKEVFKGQVAWEGDVETFDLTGHPKAKRAYAWGYPNGKGGLEVVAVLEIPPVESPVTAVRAAIAAMAKKAD